MKRQPNLIATGIAILMEGMTIETPQVIKCDASMPALQPPADASIIQYTRALDIRNVESLPRGTGCKFLVCIHGQTGELIAKQWKRKQPKLASDEVCVIFAS